MSRSVFIIAGESSGEIYGARLAEQLFSLYPGVEIRGVGGSRMREAGVEIVAGITSAIGLVEVLFKLPGIKRSLDATVSSIVQSPPDVLVLIDYPDFNFRVAKRVKDLGIRILYYVTPQVWAWRKGRVNEMREFVDRAAVLLPFEEQFLREAAIDAEFVGHPISEEMQGSVPTRADAREMLAVDEGDRCVALLPGSRDTELSRLLPVMLDTVKGFMQKHEGITWVLSIAPNIEIDKYSQLVDDFQSIGVKISREGIAALYAAADAAIVASGTAAFQAVFVGTPIVVIYKVSPLTHFIIRRLSDVKYVNLANLILDREAVRELLQSDATPEKISTELESLLFEPGKAERVRADLREAASRFKGMSPAHRTASIVGEMAGWAA